MATPTQVEPYLFFNGRTEEALEFYQKVIGAKVEMVMRFKDAPEPPPPGTLAPGFESKVMHSSFLVGAQRIMASDGCGPGDAAFNGFGLALSTKTAAEAETLFGKLADGGKVTMPFGKTFFSAGFGGVTDRFGVPWMVVAEPAQ